jgi:outer membrane protein assembly factor BamB
MIMKPYFLALLVTWVSGSGLVHGAPGDLKWAFPTSGAVRSSPALAPNGLIVFGSHDFNVYAVTTAGELKWKIGTGSRVVSSPAISGDTVYIGVAKGLVALDLSSGAERWHFRTNAVISSPAIASSGLVCVQDSYGGLYGVDPLSGQKKWQTNLFPFVVNAVCYSSPVFNREGVLFVGASNFAFNAPEPPSGFLIAVDASSGKILWNMKGTNALQSTGAIGADGTLYFGGFDKSVHAIDPLTGVEKWVQLTGDSISASATIGPDGTLFVGAHDGNLYAFDSQTGARKWKFLTEIRSTRRWRLLRMARSTSDLTTRTSTRWTVRPEKRNGRSQLVIWFSHRR